MDYVQEFKDLLGANGYEPLTHTQTTALVVSDELGNESVETVTDVVPNSGLASLNIDYIVMIVIVLFLMRSIFKVILSPFKALFRL